MMSSKRVSPGVMTDMGVLRLAIVYYIPLGLRSIRIIHNQAISPYRVG